jgi:hypothetical protein
VAAAGFREAIHYWHTLNPKRFLVFTSFGSAASKKPLPQMQADEIERGGKSASGIKVLKVPAWVAREHHTGKSESTIRASTPCEAAAVNKMPVAIHTSDPEAFSCPSTASTAL